jgi:hypothetical protein
VRQHLSLQIKGSQVILASFSSLIDLATAAFVFFSAGVFLAHVFDAYRIRALIAGAVTPSFSKDG